MHQIPNQPIHKGFPAVAVTDLIERFGLTIFCGEGTDTMEITGAYASDVLTDVLGNAPAGTAWVTVQGRENIVAVAVMRKPPVVILTGGKLPSPEALLAARKKGILLIGTPHDTFSFCGELYRYFLWG